jgi:hypothetical protein
VNGRGHGREVVALAREAPPRRTRSTSRWCRSWFVNRPVISVVVPALDEEDTIAAAIASVRDEAGEVIVADGGLATPRASTREEPARPYCSTPRPGRAAQHGATAHGDWLVFLHADTRLEPGWSLALAACPPPARRRVPPPSTAAPRLPGDRVGHAQRCRFLRLPYGDQALPARRAAYDGMGGFRPSR